MTFPELKEFLQRCLSEGRIPFAAKARQLKELHRNMCRNPSKWGLAVYFGSTPNTDWISFWQAFNRVRFHGVPWDPRNVPEEWRGLPTDWLVRLMVKSEKPRMLADIYKKGFLNNREAHQWLGWIAKRIKIENHHFRKLHTKSKVAVAHSSVEESYSPVRFLLDTKADLLHAPRLQSRLVVDWIIAKHKTEGWSRPIRTFNHQWGRYDHLELPSLLDEVREEDLVAGVRTSPEYVLSQLHYRRSAEYLKIVRANLAKYPVAPQYWLDNPVSGIEVIQSADRLLSEGETLEHCVVQYHQSIRAGMIHIISITTAAGRSTAEVSLSGAIRQHRAFDNGVPPEENKRLIGEWSRMIAKLGMGAPYGK